MGESVSAMEFQIKKKSPQQGKCDLWFNMDFLHCTKTYNSCFLNNMFWLKSSYCYWSKVQILMDPNAKLQVADL